MIIRPLTYLVTLVILAILLIGAQTSGKGIIGVSLSPTVIQTSQLCPDDSIWNAQLAGVYGAGSLRAAIQGLGWISKTQSPTKFVTVARYYLGSILSGPLQTTSIISSVAPFTFTVAMADQDEPDFGVVTLDCMPFEIPVDVSNDVNGVVTGVQCQAGDCQFRIHGSSVNGISCAPTPTVTP